jgi:hypothetical protein
MNVLEKVHTYFEQLDTKAFRNYALTAGLIYLGLICFFLYRHISSVRSLQQRMGYLNVQRQDMQVLLARYGVVKNQQTEVDKLLEKDKDFKIGGFFNTILNTLGIAKLKSREPETSKELLDNGYTEVKLYASFNAMDMKTIATLLDKLEQNARIYTKEVEVYKPNGATTLNLNLIIATLEPKTETSESAE